MPVLFLLCFTFSLNPHLHSKKFQMKRKAIEWGSSNFMAKVKESVWAWLYAITEWELYVLLEIRNNAEIMQNKELKKTYEIVVSAQRRMVWMSPLEWSCIFFQKNSTFFKTRHVPLVSVLVILSLTYLKVVTIFCMKTIPLLTFLCMDMFLFMTLLKDMELKMLRDFGSK